jgi:hypothetical protein
VHIILGVVSAFAIWRGTESPVPLGALVVPGGSWGMIIFSIWAWAPYIVSYVWARHILRDSRRAVLAFIAGAPVFAFSAVTLMRNTWEFRHPPAPIFVSAGLTIVLVALAGICVVIFPDSATNYSDE